MSLNYVIFCKKFVAKSHYDKSKLKRRVALVRAIAYGGDALILDEPFNGLDTDNKQIAADIIKREFINKPVLLITHVKEDAQLLDAKTINI